jgi:hypothetical protein
MEHEPRFTQLSRVAELLSILWGEDGFVSPVHGLSHVQPRGYPFGRKHVGKRLFGQRDLFEVDNGSAVESIGAVGVPAIPRVPSVPSRTTTRPAWLATWRGCVVGSTASSEHSNEGAGYP